MTNNEKQVSDKEQIYGKYSLGSGGVLSNPDTLYNEIGDSEVIESYKNSIKRDLKKGGISLDELKDFHILDVGTGRQAIAFNQLGAKKVNHYDISPNNVQRMKEFIKINSLEDKITTECLDLVKQAPPKDEFDLVFLHGIVQHFSHTGLGLKNCLEAVKEKGYLSLYFYRSGTFFNFLVYLIRDLIKNTGDYKEYFVNSILLYSENCGPNYFVSQLMDSLFVPHMHLYAPDEYISFVKAFGFEIISSSKLDPYGKRVDHTYAHPSVVITCKRMNAKNPDLSEIDLLSPGRSVDQLDPKNYLSDDRMILNTIECYNSFKQIMKLKNTPPSIIMSLAFKLYKYLQNLDHGLERNINVNEGNERHQGLVDILNDAKSLIEKEF